KERVLSWMEALKAEGVVADAYIMSGMFANGSTMKEVRLAAAQHGADAVLVLRGAYQTDSYLNFAAVLNLTLVGGFLVPASHRDPLFIMRGGLVDVGTGFLYATAESEGEGSIVRPTYLVEEKDAIEQAKKQALDRFGPELIRRLLNLRGTGAHLLAPRVVQQPPNPIRP